MTEIETEAALLNRAHRFEASARAALERTHPDEVEAVVRRCEANGDYKTPGPLRLALRTLARQLQHPVALSAFKTADAFYWQIVLASERAVHYRAWCAERRRGLERHDLDGVFYWIAFQAAIRMEPGRVLFRTHFRDWVLSMAPRAPELRSVVKVPAFRVKMPAIYSLDVAQENHDTGASHLLVDELEAPESGWMDHLIAVDFLAMVKPRLSQRSAEILPAFLSVDGDNNAEIARKGGCSREFIRQRRDRLTSECRRIAGLE